MEDRPAWKVEGALFLFLKLSVGIKDDYTIRHFVTTVTMLWMFGT